MIRILKRMWIPLVLVVVLAVSGLIVMRLHKIFASQDLNAAAGAGIEIVQFHPKIMVYDVFGPAGTTPRSVYLDADANVHEAQRVACRGQPRYQRRCLRSVATSWRRATVMKSVAVSPWTGRSGTRNSRWGQRANLLPGEVRMTDTAIRHPKRPLIAHSLRLLAVPIVLFWVSIAVIVNAVAPQLEVVGEAHAAPMAPADAPSMQAMKRMGANFKEFDSNSTVMIVVEGQQRLGEDAHPYYDGIIRQLEQDPAHIQHIQDFWGDTFTAAGAQSADGKASYVMLNLAGDQGTTLANEAVDAVRKVMAKTTAPPGVKAYVAGPAALTDDLHVIGNASLGRSPCLPWWRSRACC